MNMVLPIILLLTGFTTLAQLAVPTFQPQFFSGRATYNNRNFSLPSQFNPQRMIPYGGTNAQQQTQKQPLRAHNNRYPVNRSNIMGFGPYARINLRDHKTQATAAQKYKEKLSSMRINLRAYRIQPVQPVTPTTPTQPQPQPQPQPPNTDNPDNPDNPDNNEGQVGIGGGAGPVPPSFPPAVGMPAPQPR